MDKYITEPELAEKLQVSRTFLWEMRAADGLPYCKMGRTIRYNPKAVADWLSRHEHENSESETDPKGDQK